MASWTFMTERICPGIFGSMYGSDTGKLPKLTIREADEDGTDASRKLVATLNESDLADARVEGKTGGPYTRERVLAGVARLEEILQDPSEPAPLREALAVAVGETVRTRRQWIPGLVSPLLDGDGVHRATAARTLARIAPQPTRGTPAFWVSGPEADRKSEVAAWRHGLASQDS